MRLFLQQSLRNTGAVIGMAILAVLILYPLSMLLIQIVFPQVFAVNPSWRPGLGPIVQALHDPSNLTALTNSLTIALASTVIAALVGTLTAFVQSRASRRWKMWIDGWVWLVLFAPSYIIAQGWMVSLQDGGALAQVFHLSNGWSDWFFSRFGLILVMGFKFFPFVHIALTQAIANIGSEFSQAARMNGANPRQVLLRVLLPLMAPGLLAGMTIVFAEGFGDFGFAAAITPTTHIPLVPYQIYAAMSQAPVDFSSAALMSLVLIVVTGGALGLQFWWLGQRSYVTVSGNSRTPSDDRPAWYAYPAVVLTAVITLGLPLGGSVLVSLWNLFSRGISPGNWTLAHYGSVFATSAANPTSNLHALAGSLMYGVAAAGACSVLGLFLGYQLVFRGSRVNTVTNIITMASIAVPGVVLAAGYIFAWNAAWIHTLHWVIYGTSACLTLAYIAGTLPYAIRLQHGAMSQISPNLLTSARLAGAREKTVLVRIVLPLVSATALSTFFLTFTHTVFELPASMLLYPPGGPTFSVVAEEQFSAFNWGQGSALAILGMTVVLLSYLLGRMVSQWTEKTLHVPSEASETAPTVP